MRRRIRTRAGKNVKRFRDRVRLKLGAMDGRKPWKYVDYARLLLKTFGRLRGLWRMFFILCELLQEIDEGQSLDVLGSMVVADLKCLHQVALDDGDWAKGELFLETPDPLAVELYAGEPAEMESIAKYRKAHRQLRQKSVKAENVDSETSSDSNPEMPKKQKKAKKKKEKAATKAKAKAAAEKEIEKEK